MGDFESLHWAARQANDTFPFLLLVDEWGNKRQHIACYLHDMPGLVGAYERRATKPHLGHSEVVEVDPLPGLRLAAACEGLANSVYGACDIAATFGNAASDSIPRSFNQFCKKVRIGKLDGGLVGGVENLEWYARVREIRTEWAHHSSIFIGVSGDQPVVVVKPLRRRDDRVVLPEQAMLRVQELLDWSGRAVHVIDRFGIEVYKRYVLPRLDLDSQVVSLELDARGFPIVRDRKVQTYKTTMREYLRRGGFDL